MARVTSGSKHTVEYLIGFQYLELSRRRWHPARYENLSAIYNACSFALTAADPTSYEEAIKDEDWLAAMQEEM